MDNKEVMKWVKVVGSILVAVAEVVIKSQSDKQ